MATDRKSQSYAFIALKLCAVVLFMGGFVYQTMEFLYLYWTYPTVVDIQESSPTYLDVPAFTFCNKIGFHFERFCDSFKYKPCVSVRMFKDILTLLACSNYEAVCTDGQLDPAFRVMMYPKFMSRTSIKQTDIPVIAIPLEDYLHCTIEFAGKTTECDMQNVLGSFYTTEDLPQLCYTIYSLWGNPNGTRHKIPKGARMVFEMQVNTSHRQQPEDAHITGEYLPPLGNAPADASVQIAVHSPYFLPSPFLTGSTFMAGRHYEMRITQKETHLLPGPYQTNCTDYMTPWHQRGGKAPIDQLRVIQECRVNVSYEVLGCVPVTIDYPHSYDLCRKCDEINPKCKWHEPPNTCTLLAEHYNQPCESITYDVKRENLIIYELQHIGSGSIFTQKGDGIRVAKSAHDCSGKKKFSEECGSIIIFIPFDQFMITNLTYNPKFESLELFSVVGGYMGMWLGISLLTVFDVFSDGVVMLKTYIAKRKPHRVRRIHVARESRIKSQGSTSCEIW